MLNKPTQRNQQNIRVAGIILNKNNVLLMKRKKNGKEYYVFPGGGKELNESLKMTVIRELQEETSIIATPEKLLYQLQILGINDLEKYNKSNFSKIEYYFLCTYISGEPRLNINSIEYKRIDDDNTYEPQWVPINSLSDLVIYPLEIRDSLIKNLNNGFAETVQKNCISYFNLRN